MTVNRVTLIGNLGADPEIRTTQSDVVVCNLRIATSERQKDRDGNWADHTEWHRVACFGKTAENCGKFLQKGRQVYIDGKIRTNKYQDKEGKDRWSTEIIAREVRFLGSKEGNSSGGGGYSGGGSGSGGGGNSGGGYGGGSGNSGGGGGQKQDSDIPF